MRILQVTAWFSPANIGGTEVYLQSLIGELRKVGVECSVLVPRRVGAADTFLHCETEIESYPVNEVPAPGELQERRPHIGFEEFCARLSLHRGSIYHQHAWTRGCGFFHLRAARELGLKTVLTIHVPGSICLRGTMLRFGEGPCDGHVEERLCGACWAQAQGMPRALAGAVARLPLRLARRARHRTTRVATVLAARALGAQRTADVADMIHNADRVVAVCGWLHDALVANGVPPRKLVLSRQGISSDFLEEAQRAGEGIKRTARGPLRLLYVGRWHPVKGIDVVVRAVCALPRDTGVELSVYAVVGTADEVAYEQKVRSLAGGDARIKFAPPLPRGMVSAVMAGHDALVVPSLWLETGPLVILEALAVGLHVIGSRLGGIAELVNESNGELLEAGNVSAWGQAIARLAQQHLQGLPPRFPRSVRTMSEAAADMVRIYSEL